MALPLYLAMTGQEIARQALPQRLAYMACHLSPYEDGLWDLPPELPPGSLLILDDRIPLWRHDPALIARQLSALAEETACDGCLLDFQHPGAGEIAKAVVQALPCPVAVTEGYAADLDCGVFLTAPQPNKPLYQSAEKWPGRTLWLEAALETVRYTLDPGGSHREEIPYRVPEPPCHRHEKLCCSYHMEVSREQAVFTISRTREDVGVLLEQAENLGFQRAVGLYQQLFQRE